MTGTVGELEEFVVNAGFEKYESVTLVKSSSIISAYVVDDRILIREYVGSGRGLSGVFWICVCMIVGGRPSRTDTG